MSRNAAYDADFHAWTQEQAAALRRAAEARVNIDIDFANLAEEIESMGKSDLRTLKSSVARVIEHLLKLEHSPASEPRAGWAASVAQHRMMARDVLEDSPGLVHHLEAAFEECYRRGCHLAAIGLQLQDSLDPDVLPAESPYSLGQVLGDDWWPGNRHGLD